MASLPLETIVYTALTTSVPYPILQLLPSLPIHSKVRIALVLHLPNHQCSISSKSSTCSHHRIHLPNLLTFWREHIIHNSLLHPFISFSYAISADIPPLLHFLTNQTQTHSFLVKNRLISISSKMCSTHCWQNSFPCNGEIKHRSGACITERLNSVDLSNMPVALVFQPLSFWPLSLAS